MRKNLGTICIVLGTLFVIAALLLFGWNQFEDRRAGEEAYQQLPELVTYIEEQKMTSVSDPLSEWYETDPLMAEAEINGYTYIGFLTIPNLDLELPVLSDWDYARLKIAPCRYTGSVKTDDLVIAAHNYSRHFGKLSQLVSGDPVYFTDVDGVLYSYETEVVETLEPDAVDEMTDSGYALSLFTCTYGGQMRVTVRCNRVTD